MDCTDSDQQETSRKTQKIQIRDSNPTQSKMFYYVKCKHALILCGGIFLLHFILIAVAGQLDTGQQGQVVGQVGQVEDIELLDRERRDLSDIYIPPDVDVAESCSSGHIDGLPAICDSHGCLRMLGSSEVVVSRGNGLSGLPMGGFKGQGRVSRVHLDLLALLTSVQRLHGIYGTVAGIGAGEPFIAVLLASQMDLGAGEHLFLSDPSPTSTTRRFDQLYSHINNMGSEDDHQISRFHVHVGSATELTKGLLLGWNLPQCRIVVVEGTHDSSTIYARLEKALCLLREGGIVILNGIDRNQEQTFLALRHFFQTFGPEILVPLFSTPDKLYLSTDKSRRKYIEHIASSDFLVRFHAREIKSTLYGPTYSYYVLDR